MSMHLINLSLWFVCKSCRRSFQTVYKFFEHKIESHFNEFRDVKCIVFEENSLNSEFVEEHPLIDISGDVCASVPVDVALMLNQDSESTANTKNESFLEELQSHPNVQNTIEFINYDPCKNLQATKTKMKTTAFEQAINENNNVVSVSENSFGLTTAEVPILPVEDIGANFEINSNHENLIAINETSDLVPESAAESNSKGNVINCEVIDITDSDEIEIISTNIPSISDRFEHHNENETEYQPQAKVRKCTIQSASLASSSSYKENGENAIAGEEAENPLQCELCGTTMFNELRFKLHIKFCCSNKTQVLPSI